MYRDTLHSTRYLQAVRIAEANPVPRNGTRLQARMVVGRLLVRVGERFLAGGVDTPLGSGV